MDEDLDTMTEQELRDVAGQMRRAIRAHRDSSGHALCWHHPELWGLLPDPTPPEVAVPPWPRFIRGCVAYRDSLDRELPDAAVHDREYDG